MNPIYTFDVSKIKIQIINNKIYYETFIPNNDINKKLIENNNFQFDKCGSGIIMYDDIQVFQLSKIECNYSDYVEIKEQLEHLKKEFIQMKLYYDHELSQLKCNFSNNNILEKKDKVFPIKNLFYYDFGKSVIIECLVNDKEIIKLKYKSILNNVYNLINDKIKIIKNTKLNIISLKEVGGGFYYLDNLGISVQGVDSNRCLLEIITQCVENKIKLYIEIKLIDNNIIKIKVVESILFIN